MKTTTRRQQASFTRCLAGLTLVGALTLSGCQMGLGDGDEPDDEPPQAEEEASDGGGDADPEATTVDGEEDPSDGGGDADPEATSDAGGTEEDGGDESVGGEEDAVYDEDAQAYGVDVTDAGEPVATVEVPADVSDDDGADMTIALHGLERKGDTVEAVFSFTVNSTGEDTAWLPQYLGDKTWTPYAVDRENLNKHGTLGQDTTGSESGAQTSFTNRGSTPFAPGQTYYGFAIFAAPPEDVKTMDVLLVEGEPLAEGVEIA